MLLRHFFDTYLALLRHLFGTSSELPWNFFGSSLELIPTYTCLKMKILDLRNTKIVLEEIQRWYHLSANADGWVWQMQNDQTSKSRYMQQHFMAMINKLYAWSILIIAMQRLLIMTRYKIYHAFLFHRILKILTAWRMLQISAPKKEISSFPTIYIMGEGGICLKWVELNILSKK